MIALIYCCFRLDSKAIHTFTEAFGCSAQDVTRVFHGDLTSLVFRSVRRPAANPFATKVLPKPLPTPPAPSAPPAAPPSTRPLAQQNPPEEPAAEPPVKMKKPLPKPGGFHFVSGCKIFFFYFSMRIIMSHFLRRVLLQFNVNFAPQLFGRRWTTWTTLRKSKISPHRTSTTRTRKISSKPKVCEANSVETGVPFGAGS